MVLIRQKNGNLQHIKLKQEQLITNSTLLPTHGGHPNHIQINFSHFHSTELYAQLCMNGNKPLEKTVMGSIIDFPVAEAVTNNKNLELKKNDVKFILVTLVHI